MDTCRLVVCRWGKMGLGGAGGVDRVRVCVCGCACVCACVCACTRARVPACVRACGIGGALKDGAIGWW